MSAVVQGQQMTHSTKNLLNAAQATIESLTEELVQLRQENSELKTSLLSAEKSLHMQRLAVSDERHAPSNDRSVSDANSASMGHQAGRMPPYAVALGYNSPAARYSAANMSATGITPTPLARAKQLLQVEPPFEPQEISAIVMIDDEDEEEEATTVMEHGHPVGISSAEHSPEPQRQPRGPQLPCDSEEEEPQPASAVDRRPKNAAAMGKLQRLQQERQNRQHQQLHRPPAPNAELEAYVKELRTALHNMNSHAEKKRLRANKLEKELAVCMDEREKDLKAAYDMKRILEAARKSEEGARKMAHQAKRESAKAREECEAIRQLAATTIEDLTLKLRDTVAANAQQQLASSPPRQSSVPPPAESLSESNIKE